MHERKINITYKHKHMNMLYDMRNTTSTILIGFIVSVLILISKLWVSFF